ncbi:MAG TPA: O-antigen ligase family protein [Phycisphaerales bacterium]|nr:O-antigen ligase family protein [Phycisphaerales bacterium]
MELAGVPLAIAFLTSLDVVWPVLRWWVRQRLVWLLAAWAAWVGLSLLWSLKPEKGVWELASLRFAYPLLAAWPLLRHRRAVIYALCMGFLATNASQLALWLGHTLDLKWLMFKEWHPRNAGWWGHATVCGYLFVAALGLHLPAAMMGRGWARWAGLAGGLVTVAGMIATGARGAWIAGAALIVLVAGVALVTRRWSLRTAAIAGVVLAVAVAGGWLVAGESIARRGREGVQEVRAALTQEQYETDTGARIKFAKWAVEMGVEKPLLGHGAGSYWTWVQRRLSEQGVDPASVRTAPQAHNLWLHAWATLGVVGVVLAAAIAWMATRGAFAGLTREQLGTYDAGPAFALVGMLLVTPFDVAYVNSPPSALLAVLFALSLWPRPLREPLGGRYA